MNVPKTKLMKVMTKQVGTVNIGQEEVEEFQYLVVSLVKPVAHAKISRHASVKHEMHLSWRTNSLSLKTKLRIFSSNVKSALLYGSETRQLTAT